MVSKPGQNPENPTIMKINARPGRPAFTLIELLAVITIIVILASLVVGGLSFVTERQAREKARVQIALISKALEDYKLDMGSYPITADKATASGTAGTTTSAELYTALFYEGWEYNKNSTPPTTWTKSVGTNSAFPKSTRIYLPALDPLSTKQGWVTTQTTGDPKAALPITDPWGNQYCYRSASGPPTAASGSPLNTNTINPDFDLWSMGKDGKTNAGTSAANVKDVLNRDDVNHP